MKSLDYLFGDYGDLYWPALAAGMAMAVIAGALSVFVVARRLAFVGQGVSHTAFGGVGLAAVLGLTEAGSLTLGGQAVVAVFCTASALLIGLFGGREGHKEDTLIGVVLVGSMALGMLLLWWERLRNPGARLPSFESVLFGSFLGIGRTDALIAWVLCAIVVIVIVVLRRPMVFVVFDEPGADAAGIRTGWYRALLMGALGIAVVLVMQLAGVLLASAMLVIPGACAASLSSRLRTNALLSVGLAVACVALGVLVSFEANWPTGPAIVTVMVAAYLMSRAVGLVRRID